MFQICFKDYKGRGDVFVFSYGVVVFWGFSEDEEIRFLNDIQSSQTDSLEEPESDDFLFSDGLKSDIQSDSIALSTNDILEKLSASFAIAQFVSFVPCSRFDLISIPLLFIFYVQIGQIIRIRRANRESNRKQQALARASCQTRQNQFGSH
jgi:hypothetical protein